MTGDDVDKTECCCPTATERHHRPLRCCSPQAVLLLHGNRLDERVELHHVGDQPHEPAADGGGDNEQVGQAAVLGHGRREERRNQGKYTNAAKDGGASDNCSLEEVKRRQG
eukprot:scaffold8013_cov124-Isochrysis_galbana.AAC.21